MGYTCISVYCINKFNTIEKKKGKNTPWEG